jgi:cholest-4-en-3-one 26-monooxygenase
MISARRRKLKPPAAAGFPARRRRARGLTAPARPWKCEEPARGFSRRRSSLEPAMTAPAQRPSFDPATMDLVTPEKYEREGYPHAEWTWLREHDPVHWYEHPTVDPFWAITKHADIVDIGKNPKDWIIEPRLAVFTREIPPEPTSNHLLTMDPPTHGKYRNVVAKWFTPRGVTIWAPKVERVTREVLDQAGRKGEIDFVADVSAPITIAVIAEMLGVPRQDWPLLFRWTNEIIAPEDPEFQKGRTTEETADGARMELFQYFARLSDERRKDPKDDILSAVVQGKVDGSPIPPFELLSYYFLLVVAGNETTRNAMTGGIQQFLDSPGEWKKLAADPGLVEGAIEETVRWVTPVIQFTRTATRPMEVRGRKIQTGQSVCLYYASGNRDEEIFDEPFRFRIDRNPNNHIGFGRGEHVCLGAHLARLELRCMFSQLRERLVRMERTAPPVRARSSFVGGIKRAPMRWELRPAKA